MTENKTNNREKLAENNQLNTTYEIPKHAAKINKTIKLTISIFLL